MMEAIERRLQRALAGVRQAYRATLQSFRHRAQGSMLVRGEGLPGETLPDLELIGQAGLASGLPAGTQLVVLPIGGRTTHSVVIATEWGAYRVQVGEGEVALHHLTEPNCHVHLRAGRVVKIRGARIELEADTEILLKAPTVTSQAATHAHTGQVTVAGLLSGAGGIAFSGGSGGSVGTVNGSLGITGDATIGGKSYLGHTHSGDSGGVTGPPR